MSINKISRVDPAHFDELSVTELQRMAMEFDKHAFQLTLKELLFRCVVRYGEQYEFDMHKINQFENLLRLLLDSFRNPENWLKKMSEEGYISISAQSFAYNEFNKRFAKFSSRMLGAGIAGYISYLFYLNSKYYDATFLKYLTQASFVVLGGVFSYNTVRFAELTSFGLFSGKAEALFFRKKKVVLSMLEKVNKIKNGENVNIW